MYKYCPHCGKPFLEPDKPRTVGLVSQVKEFITWAQIKEWSDLREASKHFEIGDEIHDELKTGEPITLVVVEKDKLSLNRRSFFDTQWGSTALYAFTDSEGHHFIWKTASWPDSMTKVNEGDSIVLKGTIKEHNEYKGCKQTVLTRCKIVA